MTVDLYILFTCLCFPPPSASGPFCVTPPTPVVVRATGIGYPPRQVTGRRASLLARRAAEVTAVRNLARKLDLPPHTRLSGFRYVSSEQRPDGAFVVTVEYKLPWK